MTTTIELRQTVASLIGDPAAEAAIAQVANAFNFAPFCAVHVAGECDEQGDVWDDEDAAEIVERVSAGDVDFDPILDGE